MLVSQPQHSQAVGKNGLTYLNLHKECDLLVMLCTCCQHMGRRFAGTRSLDLQGYDSAAMMARIQPMRER